MDFDEASKVTVWNDYDPAASDPTNVENYVGLSAIGGYYASLFQDLATRAGFTQVFTKQQDDADAKIVLWVWQCTADGFEQASVTTIFGSNFKVQAQNVVITKASSGRRLDQERAMMAGRISSSRVAATTAREATEVLNAPVDVQDAVGQYMAKVKQRALWPDMVQLYATGAEIWHYEWLTNEDESYNGHVLMGNFYETDSARFPGSLYATMTDPANLEQRLLRADASTRTAFVQWDVLPDTYNSVSMTFLYDSDFKIVRQTAVTRRPSQGGNLRLTTKSMMMV